MSGTGVLSWLDDPPPDRGLRFSDGRGRWTFHSYDELSRAARRAARRLRDAGTGPGDVAFLIHPPSARLVADLFGSLLAGVTPALIAPPTAFRGGDVFRDHLSHLVRTVRPSAMVTSSTAAGDAIAEVAAAHGAAMIGDAGRDGPGPDDPPGRPDIGLIQFSSGSTGAPRAACLPLSAVDANVSAIGRWLGITPRDVTVSWLPFHHDMGLVGMLLTPMAHTMDAWFMRPEEFVGAPARWLATISAVGATMTATPAFGLGHALRLVRPQRLAGLGLHRLRSVIVGAERVDAGVLDGFRDLLEPYGLARTALMPAYGLAESTLAVTGTPMGANASTVSVDPMSLAPGRRVRLTDPSAATAITLTSCGRPLGNAHVAITAAGGGQADEGVLGEITVRGASLATERIGEERERIGDVLHTGDMGFLLDGELYVVGRAGDSVKHRGRWVFADDVERVAVAASPRPRHTVALLGSLGERETAFIVLEGSTPEAARRVGAAVAAHPFGLRVLVKRVPTGWIRRTTSGKAKRREMWSLLATDRAMQTDLEFEANP